MKTRLNSSNAAAKNYTTIHLQSETNVLEWLIQHHSIKKRFECEEHKYIIFQLIPVFHHCIDNLVFVDLLAEGAFAFGYFANKRP